MSDLLGTNGDPLVKILTAFDEAQAGEEGEIVASGRRIHFKAKWRFHSQMEPLVWDATAQDEETGIRVKVKHQDTDKYANRLAIQKLLEELKSKGRSLPYLCTKNEAMAPLHVATLTVQRELPKYEIILSIYRVSTLPLYQE